MTVKVIYPDKGYVSGQSNRLGGVHSHQERTSQAGTFCYSDTVKVTQGYFCFGHRLDDYRNNGKDMLAGSYFGDNTPVAGVDFKLRGYLI